jgi:sugar phosphate isomerase/epimerase
MKFETSVKVNLEIEPEQAEAIVRRHGSPMQDRFNFSAYVRALVEHDAEGRVTIESSEVSI